MTKVFLILAVTAAAVVMLADSHSISKFEHSDEEQRLAAGIDHVYNRHHRSKRTIGNIMGMFQRMMSNMFGGGKKGGKGKGGGGGYRGRLQGGRGKGKKGGKKGGRGRPSSGYGVPQARPISNGYGAPQRPQAGYGAPQAPVVSGGYRAPQQHQQQPQRPNYNGGGGGNIGGGGGGGGALDSYGAPQAPVVSSVPRLPQHQQIQQQAGSGYSGPRPAVAPVSSYGSSNINNAEIIVGQGVRAMAPSGLSNTVIKMLPAPNLATAAPSNVNSFPAANSYSGSVSTGAQNSYTSGASNNFGSSSGSNSVGSSFGFSSGGSGSSSSSSFGSLSGVSSSTSFNNAIGSASSSAPDSYGIPQGNVISSSSSNGASGFVSTSNGFSSSPSSSSGSGFGSTNSGNGFTSSGSTSSNIGGSTTNSFASSTNSLSSSNSNNPFFTSSSSSSSFGSQAGSSAQSAPDSYGIPQGNVISSGNSGSNTGSFAASSSFGGGSSSSNLGSGAGSSISNSVIQQQSAPAGGQLAPDSYGIPLGNVVVGGSNSVRVGGVNTNSNGVSIQGGSVVSSNTQSSFAPASSSNGVVNVIGSSSGNGFTNSGSGSAVRQAAPAPDSYGIPQASPVSNSAGTVIAGNGITDNMSFASGNKQATTATGNSNSNAAILAAVIAARNNPANGNSNLGSGSSATGSNAASTSAGNNNFQSIISSISQNSNSNNAGVSTPARDVYGSPLAPVGTSAPVPAGVLGSNQPTSFDTYGGNNNNNQGIGIRTQIDSGSNVVDSAPEGEVVSTQVEGENKNQIRESSLGHILSLFFFLSGGSSARPPIEIDLTNGQTDVDLTNGLANPGSTIPDVDLTGTSTTAAPDTDGADEEIDYSQYYDDDYGDDEDDPFKGIPGLDPDAPGFGGAKAERLKNKRRKQRPGRLIEQVVPEVDNGLTQAEKEAQAFQDEFEASLYDDEVAFLEEYDAGEPFSEKAEPPLDLADVSVREGKKTAAAGLGAAILDALDEEFDPAQYEDLEYDDDDFFEYEDTDEEEDAAAVEDGNSVEGKVGFISVPLKIQEVASDEKQPGDPTLILAGSPPENEEDEDEVTTDEPEVVTIRGRGVHRRPSVVVRRGKKRVGEESGRGEAVRSSNRGFFTESDADAAQKSPRKRKTAGAGSGYVDWSTRLRERKRKQIWQQFRLDRRENY